MPLAYHLPFFDEQNYTLLSLVIGVVLGILPGLGPAGPLASGFLYAYFTWWFGRAPRDPVEGAKRGAVMGAVVGATVSLLSFLLVGWGLAVYAVHPGLWFLSGLALVFGLISGAIVGAILGGMGGFLAPYID